MASYDGAETCEVVSWYLLAQLQQLPNIEIGLYRNDGLAVTTLTPKETERIKKQICNVFKNNNLKITIEANKKVVNFHDITLDMNTEKFKPYTANQTIHPALLKTFQSQLTEDSRKIYLMLACFTKQQNRTKML